MKQPTLMQANAKLRQVEAVLVIAPADAHRIVDGNSVAGVAPPALGGRPQEHVGTGGERVNEHMKPPGSVDAGSIRDPPDTQQDPIRAELVPGPQRPG